MPRKMGLDFGLEKGNCIKTKYRWLFFISDVSSSSSSDGIKSLPPLRSARPHLSFQEMQAKHLNEDIYYPAKPDWKPVSLVLYDLVKNNHPVMEWVKLAYDTSPRKGTWSPSCGDEKGQALVKQQGELTLYNGCGSEIETWVFENIWPQTVNFLELDMASEDLVLCELTLRYARAYVRNPQRIFN